MKTGLRIPSQLFLAAGKDIESALREATLVALQEHDLRNPIATWEDGKVVFIHSQKALDKMWAQFPDVPSSSTLIERIMSRDHEEFLNLVFESALQIYIKDEKLHFEFSGEEQGVGDLLAKPENAGRLQNICRTITGRDMEAQLIIVGDQSGNPESGSARRLAADMRRLIVETGGDRARAVRLMASKIRRAKRQIEGSSPDSLPAAQTVPAEGDDLTSHKGE
jgi:hypothetical protein